MEESIQSKGGKARAVNMTSVERSICAKNAANARWVGIGERYVLSMTSGRKIIVQAPLDVTKAELDRMIEWLRLTLVFD